MKKILLVCSAGMSTSLLVNKMKEAAKAKGIEVWIDALPVAESSSAIDGVDIVLLGPQVRFMKAQFEKKVAPLGDPIEICVRGYSLSLRKEDAKSILVEML